LPNAICDWFERSFTMKRFLADFHFSLIILVLMILLASCSQQKDGMSVISGNIEPVSDANTFLRLVRIDTLAYTPIDSVKPGSDGSFSFKISPDKPGFYLLQSGQKTLAPVVIYPGDSIKVTSAQGILSFSGGAEAGIFDNFRQSLLLDEAIVDSLGTVVMLARDLDNYEEFKKSTDSAWAALMHKAKERSIAYLNEHPEFLSQILVINSKIRQTFIFDQTADSTWLYMADAQLTGSHGNSPHAIAFHNRIKLLRKANQAEERARENMMPGKNAPGISLPGINGKVIPLSPSKNKYTLVYIWSPADGPSRKSNQELKMLHDKYKSSGFDVYAVSLDHYRDRWAAAVNLDKLWWNNVNDTLAMNSPVVKEWYVTKLPVFVLVDQKGKIVERFTSVQSLFDRLSVELGK
jgi:peroxiredoxin